MGKRGIMVKPVDEDAVRRIAQIIGPCSAADQALAELDARRRDGEDVAIFQTPSGWVVGPPLRNDPMTAPTVPSDPNPS